MRRALAWAILMPIGLLADTLILRDGTRHNGTFVSGTARIVTFVDDHGSRRNFEMRNVQEIQFGTGTTPTDVTTGSQTDDDRRQLLRKIREDARLSMDNVTLGDYQRGKLEGDLGVLDRAISETREGESVSVRELRTALEGIRLASSAFREQDRTKVRESISELRRLRNDYNPTGATRSRAR